MVDQQRVEALGPAERVVSALTTMTDHIVHNRPGMVVPNPNSPLGVTWFPALWKEEEGRKSVYKLSTSGNKRTRHRVGVLQDDGRIVSTGGDVGVFRKPGLFREAVAHYYGQAAEIWKADNEFAARWASWAFPKDHRDTKVILCALMLVQNRMGEPVVEDGEILFRDDDYRNVGEAMCLLRDGLSPKLLRRVGEVLNMPEVAAINRQLGFGQSARRPPMGRYNKVVTKWLEHRENNPKILEGLTKAGYRTTVMALARWVGYKPKTPEFFRILRWKQTQSNDGRRTMNLGETFADADTWAGWDEAAICRHIVMSKTNWKVIAGRLSTSEVGMTPAIVAAAIESGSMSDKDLIILTPTLEELGLLKVDEILNHWKRATKAAEDQRAANIARNVKSREAQQGLEEAVDVATEKAMEAVTRDLRVWVVVDKSASMDGALDRAQTYLTKFLGGFPLERTHVSVFNTVGMELTIRAPRRAAVEQAFRGHSASGGTQYWAGVAALADHQPQENEDLLIIFVGDEEGEEGHRLADAMSRSGIKPAAFGLLKVVGSWGSHGDTVRAAATHLRVPCFDISEDIFESDDPYAITRVLQNLIATTPVSQTAGVQVVRRRKPLVQEILETPLLEKPVWA